jgi:hypothetical protein
VDDGRKVQVSGYVWLNAYLLLSSLGVNTSHPHVSRLIASLPLIEFSQETTSNRINNIIRVFRHVFGELLVAKDLSPVSKVLRYLRV